MSSIIDAALASNLIKEYRAQNAANGGPTLVTNSGDFLNGFYIDRASLDSILSNPDIEGMHVYLAKHPDFVGAPENAFTIVFTGSTPNPAWVEGSTTELPYLNPDDPWDFAVPCPPNCGPLGC